MSGAMIKFRVTEKSQRPARKDGTCFYCNQPIGGFHEFTCVLISKKVKVRMTVDYHVEVPAYWDSHMIEFHRNEGSWCMNNAIQELENISNKNGCLCETNMNFSCEDSSGEAYLKE